MVNYLLKRGKIEMGSEVFGNAFEHLIYHEIYTHSQYSGLEYPVHYWRTASQLEVDFILGDNEVAIEVKSTANVSAKHLHGLKKFAEEYHTKQMIVVCNEPMPRLIQNILVLPWNMFLQKLWAGEIMPA
jgi:predicted AAA+ superfamily ATPase